MSEFKFACPVCGQHITCDSAKSGTQLDCPTCFQKLIVPHAPEGDVSKLILNASLARSRPLPQNGGPVGVASCPRLPAVKFPVAAILVLVCAVGALFLFRGHFFNQPARPTAGTATNDPAWKLDLTGVTIPDTPVAGRINGRVFKPQRAILHKGALTFVQGQIESPELGLRITLFVREAGQLAGKSINVETNHTRAPNIAFGWRDEPQQPLIIGLPPDYALNLQFGAVANDRLPGKIYFCATDETKSWLAGTFDAEIIKSSLHTPPMR